MHYGKLSRIVRFSLLDTSKYTPIAMTTKIFQGVVKCQWGEITPSQEPLGNRKAHSQLETLGT